MNAESRRYGEGLMWASGHPLVGIAGNGRGAIVTMVVGSCSAGEALELLDVDGGRTLVTDVIYTTRDPIGLLCGHYANRLWVRTRDAAWLVLPISMAEPVAALLLTELAGRLGSEPRAAQVADIAVEFGLAATQPQVPGQDLLTQTLALANGEVAGLIGAA
jgi:hypothetical protein